MEEQNRPTLSPDERSDPPTEPISPELVLIDPGLRRVVLGSAQYERARSNGSTRQLASEPEEPSPTLPIAPASPSGRQRWTGLAIAALCGSMATIGVGVAIAGFPVSSTDSGPGGALSDVDESVTLTESQTVPVFRNPQESQDALGDRRAATTPSRTVPRRSATPATSPRRFAWAPVSGVAVYEVAFYRANVPVFRARTKSPSIVVPELARGTGKRLLGPGTYRWYVWPVRNGRVASVALVRSTFVVAPN
jgi:hypothetical protein